MSSNIDIDELEAAIGMVEPVEKEASSLPQVRSRHTAPAFELDDDGEEYMGIGVDGVLASTEKLLAINRGLAEPDERDSLKFQKVMRTHGMLREGIKMDAGKIARTAMYRAAKTGNLDGMGPGVFDGYVTRMLVGNQLTSPLEEINPMQLTENARRITKMGIGGLRSSQSITEDAQAVHPSQFGFIDVVAGPECLVDNCIVHTSIFTDKGFIRISELTDEHKILCRNDDGSVYFSYPERVVHEEYNGPVICYQDSINNPQCYPMFAVTPTHRVVVADRETGKTSFIKAQDLHKQNIEREYGGVYIPTLTGYSKYVRFDDVKVREHTGLVHCCTVPGGMFCISVDGSVPFWTGNSEKAGIDVRAAWGTKLGSNGRIYQKMLNRRTGRMQWVSSDDLDGMVMKIPD